MLNNNIIKDLNFFGIYYFLVLFVIFCTETCNLLLLYLFSFLCYFILSYETIS